MKIRQVAPDISGIRADHVARYQFVVDKIRELNIPGNILDVGCGVGYGSHLMERKCNTSVKAIDISQDAIDYAIELLFSLAITLKFGDSTLQFFSPVKRYWIA